MNHNDNKKHTTTAVINLLAAETDDIIKSMDVDALHTCLAETALEKNDELLDHVSRGCGGTGTFFSKFSLVREKHIDDLISRLNYGDKTLAAATVSCSFNSPLKHDRGYKALQNRALTGMIELREDIDITKALIDEMADQQFLEDHQKQLTYMLWEQACLRKIDAQLVFVSVNDLTPREAVKYVQAVSQRLNVEIEPIDLTLAFEGVQLIIDDPLDILPGEP